MYRFMLILGIILTASSLFAQEPENPGTLGPVEHWPRILDYHNKIIRELLEDIRVERGRDFFAHDAILLLGELRAAEAAEPLLEIIGLEFVPFHAMSLNAPLLKAPSYPAQKALISIGKPASTKAVEFLAKNDNDFLAKLHVKLIIRIEGHELGKEMVRLAAEKEKNEKKRARLRKALTLFNDITDEDIERRDPDSEAMDWRKKNRKAYYKHIDELIAVVKAARTIPIKENEERGLDCPEHLALVLLGDLHASQAVDMLLEIMDRRFFGSFHHVDGRPRLVFSYPVPDALVKIGKPASRKAVELLAKEENVAKVKLLVKLISKIEGFELGKEMVRLAAEKEWEDERKTRLRQTLDQFKVPMISRRSD